MIKWSYATNFWEGKMRYGQSPLENFLNFAKSGWILLPGAAAAFPLANELLEFLAFPFDDQLVNIFTSMLCGFVMLVAFYLGYTMRSSFWVGLFLFPVGYGFIRWYQTLTSPIIALKSMGIDPSVAEIFINRDMILWVYWAIFACFTAAFTMITARIYRAF